MLINRSPLLKDVCFAAHLAFDCIRISTFMRQTLSLFTAYQRVTIEKGEDERNTSKVDSSAFTRKWFDPGMDLFLFEKMLAIA